MITKTIFIIPHPYEEPFRDLVLTSRRGTFAYEDVTGLPWIEIDSTADIKRANSEVLPRILEMAHLGRAEMVTTVEPRRVS
jgi:hypothetical protein